MTREVSLVEEALGVHMENDGAQPGDSRLARRQFQWLTGDAQQGENEKLLGWGGWRRDMISEEEEKDEQQWQVLSRDILPAAMLRTSVSRLLISSPSPNSYFQRESQMSILAPISYDLGVCIGVPRRSGFWGISEVPWMYPFRGGGRSGSLEMEVYVGKASKWVRPGRSQTDPADAQRRDMVLGTHISASRAST